MQELRFIGAEGAALIVSDDAGHQYRVLVDDALRDALRPRPHVRSDAPKVAPREIQQLIRAGRTIDEVVQQTGADRDDVARFEGPILAERAHIVNQARLVKVRVQPDADPLDAESATFGAVLDERLEILGADAVRWDAWKDPEDGWRVGLSFSVDGIDRDALWSFEPRAQALAPRNPTAITLSQQGELAHLQAPRLRAVDVVADESVIETAEAPQSEQAARPQPEIPPRASDPRGAQWLGAAVSGIGQPRDETPGDETSDLLEQLRRRRGERAPGPFDGAAGGFDEESGLADGGSEPSEADVTDDDAAGASVTPLSRGRERSAAVHPSTPERRDDDADPDDDAESSDSGRPHGGIHAVDVPLAGLEDTGASPHVTGGHGTRGATGPLSRRRGRASLPSWDEIVFGTRSDDDRG